MNILYMYSTLFIGLAIIGIALYFLYKLIYNALVRQNIDPMVKDLLLQITKWVFIIYFGMTVLENIGISVGPLLATVGVTGIALGFAVKDIVSNIMCGILIIIYRPFKAGDKIKMKDWEGTVQTITIRNTILKNGNQIRHSSLQTSFRSFLNMF
ncbi:mechanosensitive ion channel [bacterium]|nr:mechanosensitive ion channel [bacterium]